MLYSVLVCSILLYSTLLCHNKQWTGKEEHHKMEGCKHHQVLRHLELTFHIRGPVEPVFPCEVTDGDSDTVVLFYRVGDRTRQPQPCFSNVVELAPSRPPRLCGEVAWEVASSAYSMSPARSILFSILLYYILFCRHKQ